MKEFQSRLRELRVERGISQGGLSKALGLSRNVVTNYELGIREPSLDTLKAICETISSGAPTTIELCLDDFLRTFPEQECQVEDMQ